MSFSYYFLENSFFKTLQQEPLKVEELFAAYAAAETKRDPQLMKSLAGWGAEEVGDWMGDSCHDVTEGLGIGIQAGSANVFGTAINLSNLVDQSPSGIANAIIEACNAYSGKRPKTFADVFEPTVNP